MSKLIPTSQEIEVKNSRWFVVFGIIVVMIGIAQSLGIIHDIRQVIAHLSGMPLKEFEIASQSITKSTSLSIGPFIMLGGILIMALGRIADIGAVYVKIRQRSNPETSTKIWKNQ